MNKIKLFFVSLLLCIIGSYSTYCPAALVENSYVATSSGLVPIKLLNVGDPILSYNLHDNAVVKKTITAVANTVLDYLYAIFVQSNNACLD